MDSKEYKLITAQKEVLGHTTLQHTMQYLSARPDLVHHIKTLLEQHLIEKPAHHNGRNDIASSFYHVPLANDILLEIFNALTEQITLDETGNITRSSQAIEDLAEKWWYLVDFSETDDSL